MYEIEKKLRASKEACDIYIDKMGDDQQELRKHGRIEEHYDVAGELLVIYAERLLQAIPVKDHTRFIEIAALQELLAQLSVGYPDAAAQAQELRENMGALRMLRVAERHVKDEMRWKEREIRRLEWAREKLEEILAEERVKTSRIRSCMAEEYERLYRERKSLQHKLWEAGAAKREEGRRKRGGGFGVPGGHALRGGRRIATSGLCPSSQ